MVWDTSALVAALTGEPTAEAILDALADDAEPSVSAASLLETRIVLHARYGEEGVRDLHLLLEAAGVVTLPVDRDQVDAAFDGWVRFGKGRHPAALNFGDAFAYGLAKVRGERIAFVGTDFWQTDLGGEAIG